MATRQRPEGHRLTLTEQARRSQLIAVTIEQVAENGYAGTTLAGIARAAGITKAAVFYHFESKDSLIGAACAYVISVMTDEVAAKTLTAEAADRPAVYARSMVSHFDEHPQHTRMIVEAANRRGLEYEPEARWGPLAQLIDSAAQARGTAAVDSRTLAIITGGAIDAIVTEGLHDRTFETMPAAMELGAMIDAALTPGAKTSS
ncbi:MULTISPECIES: TetR/AcrR family transcriptional regulator [Streptomyces]|uniref:TetR/AcrR family transcriptional regulator n=1 Tax=Streptomyces TaxID=1883 RepID=UPI00081F639E|nr:MULTISPECIES: TetR/AcrR family transcriptional regulator [Streptomyces]KAA6200663.1 TetR/AcrR family transcriptional regulator [Streptomyces parvus]PVC99729.1 TetR/AcrR family transcriptional regulator [Streptomyces sp. CS147]GGS15760.1 TetR family transcriptional regulator [Streptomyces parvus]SCF68018.1 transcriptional regulator, TetR family [Streptomyces sp. Cmuel-A718b]